MRSAASPRLLAVAALSAAAALALAACGDDSAPSTDTRSTASPPIVESPAGSRGGPSTSAETSATDETATTTSVVPPTTASPDLDAASIALTEVVSGLDSPVAFAIRGGDEHLYIAEQTGRVRAVLDGDASDVVLDLSGEVSSGNEQGLLGITFSPEGSLLYVDYTDRGGTTRVVEYSFSAEGADLDTARELLAVPQPFSNHNGGDVRFGPDGLLYVSLGDGGAAGDPQGNGQRLDTLLGSILRIDPTGGGATYGIPDDNPFVGVTGARPEIWQYGLRNPWRFSFDRVTGDLWIGDVGQNSFEEIDFAPAGDVGVNWGWNHKEGNAQFAGDAPADVRDPIHDYGRDEGVAVTGGFVYRGSMIPELQGAYVFADFAAGDLIAIVEHDGVAEQVRALGVNAGSVTSFGEDSEGELYVLDRGGRVLRVDRASAAA